MGKVIRDPRLEGFEAAMETYRKAAQEDWLFSLSEREEGPRRTCTAEIFVNLQMNPPGTARRILGRGFGKTWGDAMGAAISEAVKRDGRAALGGE